MSSRQQKWNSTRRVSDLQRRVLPIFTIVLVAVSLNFTLSSNKERGNTYQTRTTEISAITTCIESSGFSFFSSIGLNFSERMGKNDSIDSLTLNHTMPPLEVGSTPTPEARSDRVAVCFFGQVKNYSFVADSVQRHVFRILDTENYTYDVFAHTYNQSSFVNIRSQCRPIRDSLAQDNA